MKVETIITPNNEIRYLLIDEYGNPVEPVMKFLKFKDHAGKSRNSLRAYCYHLKSFFDYLIHKEKLYTDVILDDIPGYMRWLQNPFDNGKIIPINRIKPLRMPATINTYVATVVNFYNYLYKSNSYLGNVRKDTVYEATRTSIPYKGFLYHIHRGMKLKKSIFLLKESKKHQKVLDIQMVENLLKACNNPRDRFLILLLWETGFRVGECLSLWLEDIEIESRKIEINDRTNTENGSEIKNVYSLRKIDVSANLINEFLNYISLIHTDEVNTNYVFVKLLGKRKGFPMEYDTVNALFRRLRKETSIFVTPHLFRHTHFDMLRRNGWGFEQIRLRGGWSNVQTPMQLYSHPTDEELREAWKMTENLFKLRGNKNEPTNQFY
ncbi:MAG: tyrosine-type recombinase/integrase [Lachnotalea sp.]